jgi:hypothetical protein
MRNTIRTWVSRAALAIAATGAVAAVSTGAASAKTPHANRPASAPRSMNSALSDYWQINNSSSLILAYTGTSGSVQAPGLNSSSIWMPGQTVTFTADVCFVEDCYGDVKFEAYKPDGTDMGTLDIHLDGKYGYGNMSLARIPQHTTTSFLTTDQDAYSEHGQSWYLPSTGSSEVDTIEDNTANSWNIGQTWQVQGLSRHDLQQSVTQSPLVNCPATPGQTECALGKTVWHFTTN